MRSTRRIAAVVAAICGAEIVVAIALGGAGLGVVFGSDGLVVAAAVLVVIVGARVGRGRRVVRPATRTEL